MESELTKFEKADFEMIIEGLEALKSRDLSSDIMVGLMEAIVIKKPEPNEPNYAENIKKWEQRQLEKEIERAKKEEKVKQFKKDIEILKSKITLLVYYKEKKEFAENSTKLT